MRHPGVCASLICGLLATGGIRPAAAEPPSSPPDKLALYAQASYGEVLRCLLEGVRWLRLAGAAVASADKSAITKARARLGAAPLKALFGRVACPLAAADTPGAWYRGRRLVGLDGTTIDLPDAPRPWSGASAARRRRAAPAATPSCAC